MCEIMENRINEKKIDAIQYVLNEEEKQISDINTLFQIC